MNTNENLEDKQFWTKWKRSLNSLYEYSNFMEMDEESLFFFNKDLSDLSKVKSFNDLEKSIRSLWNFDQRFFGGVMSYNYDWAVYSLCYLCKDEEVINHLLNIYIPLLGNDIKQELGKNFNQKVGATFVDDVGHYLWDIQGLLEPEDHGLFDWHGNRNDLTQEQIIGYLKFAGLPVLDNSDFPPKDVFFHFTNIQSIGISEKEYLKD